MAKPDEGALFESRIPEAQIEKPLTELPDDCRVQSKYPAFTKSLMTATSSWP